MKKLLSIFLTSLILGFISPVYADVSGSEFYKWLQVFGIKAGGEPGGPVEQVFGVPPVFITGTVSEPNVTIEDNPFFTGATSANSFFVNAPISSGGIPGIFSGYIQAGDGLGLMSFAAFGEAIPSHSALNFYSAGGTYASPMAIGDINPYAGSINFLGYDGTFYQNSASIRVSSAGPVSTGVTPTEMLFATTNLSGDPMVTLLLHADSSITTFSGSQLDDGTGNSYWLGTGALGIPSGSTAEQIVPGAGMVSGIRFNTDTNFPEYYDLLDAEWESFNNALNLVEQAPITITTVDEVTTIGVENSPYFAGGTSSDSFFVNHQPLFLGAATAMYTGVNDNNPLEPYQLFSAYGSTSFPATIYQQARGTFASPTASNPGDTIASISAYGFDGTNYASNPAQLLFRTGTVASGAVSSQMQIHLANYSGSDFLSMSLNPDGSFNTFVNYLDDGDGNGAFNGTGALTIPTGNTDQEITPIGHSGYSALRYNTDLAQITYWSPESLEYIPLAEGSGGVTNVTGVLPIVVTDGDTTPIVSITDAPTLVATVSIDNNPVDAIGGTVSLMNGATTITGVGTSFMNDFTVGDVVEFEGFTGTYFYIADVTDNTHADLTVIWPNANQSAIDAYTTKPFLIANADNVMKTSGFNQFGQLYINQPATFVSDTTMYYPNNASILDNTPNQMHKLNQTFGTVPFPLDVYSQAQGTYLSPTASNSEDLIGGQIFLAYDGTNYTPNPALLAFLVDGTVSPGITPIAFALELVDSSGGNFVALELGSNGAAVTQNQILDDGSGNMTVDNDLTVLGPFYGDSSGYFNTSLTTTLNVQDDGSGNTATSGNATLDGFLYGALTPSQVTDGRTTTVTADMGNYKFIFDPEDALSPGLTFTSIDDYPLGFHISIYNGNTAYDIGVLSFVDGDPIIGNPEIVTGNSTTVSVFSVDGEPTWLVESGGTVTYNTIAEVSGPWAAPIDATFGFTVNGNTVTLTIPDLQSLGLGTSTYPISCISCIPSFLVPGDDQVFTSVLVQPADNVSSWNPGLLVIGTDGSMSITSTTNADPTSVDGYSNWVGSSINPFGSYATTVSWNIFTSTVVP